MSIPGASVIRSHISNVASLDGQTTVPVIDSHGLIDYSTAISKLISKLLACAMLNAMLITSPGLTHSLHKVFVTVKPVK